MKYKFVLRYMHSRPREDSVERVVISFGKRKGKPIEHVDDEYLSSMQSMVGPAWWKKLASEVLVKRQEQSGTTASRVTLLAELKICTNTKNLERGKRAHAEAIKCGCDSCIYVATAVVNMYARCGSMSDARQVFDDIKHPDVVSWTALILGYADDGQGGTALDLFAMMRSQGCAPNSITFVAALKACTSLALKQDGSGKAECRERGKLLHMEIGCHLNIYVQTTLIDMYASCGNMIDARQVFDEIEHPNVVSWTSLILGYAENGEGGNALDLFATMKSRGCVPNSITFVAALKACASLALRQDGNGKAKCRDRGKQLHAEIVCHSDIYVQSTLIDMYAKCGSMIDARQVFECIKKPNVVSWNAIISGYAENGQGVTALELFARMKSKGCVPNAITFVAALKACGLLGDFVSGRKIHAEMDTEIQRNGILVTCLVDFYAKCGNMMEARKVFNSHPRSLRAWTALLAGYSRLGNHKAVFELFEGLQDAGFQPDGVTFLCILTCCCHAGLVEKAKEFFEAMTANYGITPTIEHYTCMIDILGNSNKLLDAVLLLRSMPCSPNPVTWMTVLGACRKWKNVEIGRLAFKSLVCLDDTSAAPYVLMAHIYGSRAMWAEQKMVLRKTFRNESKDFEDCG